MFNLQKWLHRYSSNSSNNASTLHQKIADRSLFFSCRAVNCRPHPEKAHRGGEDAFFSHPMGLGVADGVGGMAKYGVDPAIFTRNIMRYCYEIISGTSLGTVAGVKATATNTKEEVDSVSSNGLSDSEEGGKRWFPNIAAVDLLTAALQRALKDAIPGACPAVVVTMKDKDKVSILNVGDCGVMVVRDGKLLYQSKSQQHYFNCPFQLPNDPPKSGEQSVLTVKEDDVFLLASDGVLDNIERDELVEFLSRVPRGATPEQGQASCEEVAALIGQTASRNGHDEQFMSPFAKEALKHGKRFRGGKLDDITALVAKVGPLHADTYQEDSKPICPRIIEEALSLSGSEKGILSGISSFFNSKL